MDPISLPVPLIPTSAFSKTALLPVYRIFQMSWGEVKFGDDLRETQKLQLKRKRKLIQPKMEDLINRLKEEQIKILGKEAVENSK